MAFHPIPGGTMCELRYSHGPNLLENTFGYRWSGTAPTSAELLTLATEIAATIALKVTLLVSNGVGFREIHCYNTDVALSNQATYNFPTGTIGTRTGSVVASNEAAGLITRTGFRGRSSHGRKSFSEFIEGDVDGNSLSTYIMTQLASIALSVVADRVGGRFKPAVLSRLLGITPTILSALVLDTNIDSQKTRLNSHGR